MQSNIGNDLTDKRKNYSLFQAVRKADINNFENIVNDLLEYWMTGTKLYLFTDSDKFLGKLYPIFNEYINLMHNAFSERFNIDGHTEFYILPKKPRYLPIGDFCAKIRPH